MGDLLINWQECGLLFDPAFLKHQVGRQQRYHHAHRDQYAYRQVALKEQHQADDGNRHNSQLKVLGNTCLKAGAKTESSFVKYGSTGLNSSTPAAITRVVTIEDVAQAMVESTSPSLLWARTWAESRAESTQGSFKLLIFPVTKAR